VRARPESAKSRGQLRWQLQAGQVMLLLLKPRAVQVDIYPGVVQCDLTSGCGGSPLPNAAQGPPRTALCGLQDRLAPQSSRTCESFENVSVQKMIEQCNRATQRSKKGSVPKPRLEKRPKPQFCLERPLIEQRNRAIQRSNEWVQQERKHSQSDTRNQRKIKPQQSKE
jgi:hypothetical protein